MGDRSFAIKRLQRELGQIRDGGVEGCFVEVVGEVNDLKWRIFMQGPDDSPYQGGRWELQMNFPPNYPMKAPEVKFVTKIYHPNVYGNGDICMDILKAAWAPSLSATSVLLSIRSLVADPNPADAANSKAGMDLMERPEVFVREAREHTKAYAMTAEALRTADLVKIPIPAKSKAPVPTQWTCPRCTYANVLSARKCEMCDHPKPSQF